MADKLEQHLSSSAQVRYYILFRKGTRPDLQTSLPYGVYICQWGDFLQLIPTGCYPKSGCLVKGTDSLAEALEYADGVRNVNGKEWVDYPIFTPPMVRYMADTGRYNVVWGQSGPLSFVNGTTALA